MAMSAKRAGIVALAAAAGACALVSKLKAILT